LGPTTDLSTRAQTETLAGRASTETMPMSAEAAPRHTYRRLLVAIAAAVVAVAVVALLWTFWPRGKVVLPPRDMVPSGWSGYLFNGTSIDGWFPRGGQWTMMKDEEGN